MSNIRRLVLDVMKPYQPTSLEYADKLCDIEEVESVNITLLETDQQVENIKLTILGSGLVYEKIKEIIEDLAGAIHSIDEVAAGKDVIDAVTTPQDDHDL